MSAVKLCRCDIPKKQKGRVHNAVCMLYKRHVTDDPVDDGKRHKKRDQLERWQVFADALKRSLDQSGFKPSWHVLVGTSLGFACKKRIHTMGMWMVDGRLMIVVWKSPGIEELPAAPGPSADAAAAGAEAGTEAEAAAADAGPEECSSDGAASGGAARDLHVLEPSHVEAGSEVEQVVATVREFCKRTALTDTQELAQALRSTLTPEFGTIWHVVAGSEFVVETAENRRNFVLANTGKLRVVCFQHEQVEGTDVDWQKIFKILPYLLFLVFGILYLASKSVCGDKIPDDKMSLWLRGKLCGGIWDADTGTFAIVLLGLIFFCRKAPKMLGLKKS